VIIHVDGDAQLGGDGSAWSTAYRHLQDALTIAAAGDGLRVMQGTNRPDQNGTELIRLGDEGFRLCSTTMIGSCWVGRAAD
jgi:hypothetical protein